MHSRCAKRRSEDMLSAHKASLQSSRGAVGDVERAATVHEIRTTWTQIPGGAEHWTGDAEEDVRAGCL